MADEHRLHLEILGLLLQVAWADGSVGEQEVNALVRRAKDAKLSDDEIDLFRQCLAGTATLPPPNLGFLREHADEALAAVRQMISADDEVNEEEEELLTQITLLLQP